MSPGSTLAVSPQFRMPVRSEPGEPFPACSGLGEPRNQNPQSESLKTRCDNQRTLLPFTSACVVEAEQGVFNQQLRTVISPAPVVQCACHSSTLANLIVTGSTSSSRRSTSEFLEHSTTCAEILGSTMGVDRYILPEPHVPSAKKVWARH